MPELDIAELCEALSKPDAAVAAAERKYEEKIDRKSVV